MHNSEQQKVGLQWIKWYGHLSRFQDAQIQMCLNVMLHVHLLTHKNNDTSRLKNLFHKEQLKSLYSSQIIAEVFKLKGTKWVGYTTCNGGAYIMYFWIPYKIRKLGKTRHT